MKQIIKAILFPPVALMIILIPIATALTAFSLIYADTESAGAIISYVIAVYTLTVWCIRLPKTVKFFKKFKKENKLAKRWFEDEGLRVKISLTCSMLWNVAYALFLMGTGFAHDSWWFFSLSAYYLCLAVMRLVLSHHTVKYGGKGEKNMRAELLKYRACGWVFLVMNIALTTIIFFMVYRGRTFEHHPITAIAMAAYTFTSFVFAIVNLIRYKKYDSPVYSATKAISLASASVSMITLTSTMLTAFHNAEDGLNPQIMQALVGAAVSLFIVIMAVYMIVTSTKRLKKLKKLRKSEEE